MASEESVSLTSSSDTREPTLRVIYDAGRKRRAILKPKSKDIDVDATYADIFPEPAGDVDAQPCLICATAARYAGEAPTMLMTRSTSAKIMHIACVHPAELVEKHASLEYVKPKLLSKKLAAGASATAAGDVTGAAAAMSAFLSKGRLPSGFDFLTEWTLMILTDARPFMFIESEGFLRFWERASLGAHFDLQRPPSANTVARRAVLIDEALQLHLSTHVFPTEVGHTEYDSDDARAAAAASKAFTLYSASVDGWTSSSGMPVLGSTLQYITPEWEMRDLALSARYFAPPHTAVRYYELFGAILEEYGLSEGNMAVVSTDSASNMISFAEMLKVPHIRCISHAIHNSIVNTLSHKDFDSILSAPAKLSGFFSIV